VELGGEGDVGAGGLRRGCRGEGQGCDERSDEQKVVSYANIRYVPCPISPWAPLLDGANLPTGRKGWQTPPSARPPPIFLVTSLLTVLKLLLLLVRGRLV